MTIRYPNGKVFQASSNSPSKKTGPTLYGNRGMSLEDDLHDSNMYYLHQGIAVVHKKPTPIQIVEVHYPKRSAAVIKEAYFKQASTTDFNGVYKGRYIDFEAKETKNKTSFPLQNFHEHQIQHMRQVVKQNGICFVILMFSLFNEVYLLPADKLFHYWDRKESGERKSITKQEVERDGYLIPQGYQPRIDYIKIIDMYY
ncbi:Holliday junction resolvase RecU [Sutcliffiella horikoshii]|uniref:Holliday junction resolvase RecU n=1 Tax=Sutcliffiella horikoshii TaxID=79883 RepID=UPI00384FEEF7